MTTTLVADARNRAARTFVQGLEIDLGVSTAALVLASVGGITTREGLVTFGISLVKTLLTTAASYVMRRYMDGSAVPTPTPTPEPEVVPAEPVVAPEPVPPTPPAV